ncbi:hypothetical protein [Clostridium sp. AM58-1XD]|uniref:hypothetical protein n=1 Tax=Clostridium sp. AM58-1XD TaxID=2292307 RepID=UPI001FA81C97|nr:hypothetical protein [Clostridium sp. AM58-1XD]
MNTAIKSVHARQIVDCKCRPMVEVDIVTSDGHIGRGCAPQAHPSENTNPGCSGTAIQKSTTV